MLQGAEASALDCPMSYGDVPVSQVERPNRSRAGGSTPCHYALHTALHAPLALSVGPGHAGCVTTQVMHSQRSVVRAPSHCPGLAQGLATIPANRGSRAPGATFPAVPFPGWLLSRAGRRDPLGHVGPGMRQQPPSPQALPGWQTARVPAYARSLPLHTGQSPRQHVPPTTASQTQRGPGVHPRRPLLREGPLGGLLDASDHLLADR